MATPDRLSGNLPGTLQFAVPGNRPALWEMILANIGDLASLSTETKENLVAAINEVMRKDKGTVDEAAVQRIIAEYLQKNPAASGESGATYVPSVANDGTLSWENDKGLENPAPVNILGPVGPRGGIGPVGPQGEPGPEGNPGVYILAEGETLADVPDDVDVVIDPNGEPDKVLTEDAVNAMIDAKLAAVPDASEVAY